jgi:hypothetical protein
MRRAVLGLALVLCACGSGGAAQPDVGDLAAKVTAQTAKKSAHVTFELAGGTKGEGDYRVAPGLAADVRMTGVSGRTRFVLLDKVIYLRALGKQGVTRISTSSGLDGQNLPAKITMSFAGKVNSIRYSRWGQPVEVSAPPANQVTDQPALPRDCAHRDHVGGADLVGMLRFGLSPATEIAGLRPERAWWSP